MLALGTDPLRLDRQQLLHRRADVIHVFLADAAQKQFAPSGFAPLSIQRDDRLHLCQPAGRMGLDRFDGGLGDGVAVVVALEPHQ